MNMDDLLDEIIKHPKTTRELGRHFRCAEDAIARKQRILIAAGLVEEGPRRPIYDGAKGQPQKTYVQKRTRKTA